MKRLQFLILPLCAAFIFFEACKKESVRSVLQVRLTDDPAEYEEVNVDLQQVNVKLANDTSHWVSLQTNAGIYNLLALQNGVDTLIASGDLPQGTVKEVRLVLGDSNSIKTSGHTYPLTVPSGSESGLKIKIDKRLNSSLDSLVIDFDAGLSVKEEMGAYKLRPVLRVK